MRKFIKKLILICLSSFLAVFVLSSVSSENVEQKSDFTFSKHYDYYIIGHSHPECAYNDKLIRKTKNIAASGEAYFYSYFKLKKVLQENEKPKAVFIEFTNNQLGERMNEWIWDDKHISQKYVLLSPFIPISSTMPLLKNNFQGFINGYALALKSNLYSTFRSDYRTVGDLGGYRSLENIMTNDDLKTSRELSQLLDAELSEINLMYLDKMIKLCQDQNIKVFLIRSPQHAQLINTISEEIYQKTRGEKFSQLSYIDFKKYPLTDHQFADLGHLNLNGAKVISRVLDSLINTGSLDRENLSLTFD